MHASSFSSFAVRLCPACIAVTTKSQQEQANCMELHSGHQMRHSNSSDVLCGIVSAAVLSICVLHALQLPSSPSKNKPTAWSYIQSFRWVRPIAMLAVLYCVALLLLLSLFWQLPNKDMLSSQAQLPGVQKSTWSDVFKPNYFHLQKDCLVLVYAQTLRQGRLLYACCSTPFVSTACQYDLPVSEHYVRIQCLECHCIILLLNP